MKIPSILEEADIEPRKARAIAASFEQASQDIVEDLAKTLLTKEDGARLEARLEVKIEQSITKIEQSQKEMLKWMFLFWLGQAAVVAGVVKLLVK